METINKRDIFIKARLALKTLDNLTILFMYKKKLIDAVIDKYDENLAATVSMEELCQYKTNIGNLEKEVEDKKIKYEKMLDSKSVQSAIKVMNGISSILDKSDKKLSSIDKRELN